MRLQALEDRVLLDGMTVLGNWDHGPQLYSDGWVEGNYAYIGHYGVNGGLHIVDISDPTNPTEVATFRSLSGWNDFRDFETIQQGKRTIGFASSDIGGGLIIIDLTDHANPQELYRITSADGGTNTVHTLSVDGDFLYEADSRTSTIRVFNISNPESPQFVRTIVSQTGDAVHEVTALNGRLYTAEIFGRGSAEIFDITNVADPSQPVPRLGVIFPGDYVHTSWPTDDGQFVAVARERSAGDLSIWNISDPASPTLASRIVLPLSEAYCVHQVMIKGDILYASWYQAGVRVYNIHDPYNPVLLGSYTSFHGPVSGFDGTWGEFMTDGGLFFAFDMRTGITILQLDALPNRGSKRLPKSTVATPAPTAVGLSAGVLRADLTRGDDTIVVTRNALTQSIDVTVDGSSQYRFAASEVQRLDLRATKGNNLFILDPSLDLPTYVNGGPGENTVVGWPGTSPAIDGATPSSAGHAHGVRGSKYLAVGVQHIIAADGSVASVTASDSAALLNYSVHAAAGHLGGDAVTASVGSNLLTLLGGEALLGGSYVGGHLMGQASASHAGTTSAAPDGMAESSPMPQAGRHKPG